MSNRARIDPQAIKRVAGAALKKGTRVRVAGEVRFIKDRGGDHTEWGWNPPGSSERQIDQSYVFDAKNLEPLARTLRSALMALGHVQASLTTFTKIKSQRISPDGNLGGKGYVMGVKDIRKQLANCGEALSAITDTIYDEIHAPHWHPEVDDTSANPREREEVDEIMNDVEDIRDDPEEWAEQEEEEMDEEHGSTGASNVPGDRSGPPASKMASFHDRAQALALRHLARRAPA